MTWWIWLIGGLCFLAAEAFTLTFVIAYFGVGALAAAAAEALGAPLAGQVAVFAVVAFTLLVFTRRVIVDLVQARHPIVSNVHTLLGKGGVVTIPISNHDSTGQIRVGTEFWTARLLDDADEDTVPAGARVEVVDVRGVTALVRLRAIGASPTAPAGAAG